MMITLSPSSLCDVCAEEYGPHSYPHCIPCGHVLCLSCCHSIIQKTHPKHAPACPFCRETFTSDDIRMIRIDFSPSGSGWSTPRQQCIPGVYDNIVDDTEDDIVMTGLKTRTDTKVLESKVARIAAKKCSVEEVQALHKELQAWLAANKLGDKVTSLQLSALLLRAILMNHLAHSEATKSQRNAERQLRDQLDQAEAAKTKLDSDLRSLRSQFSQTAQECQSLRSELKNHKGSASGFSSPTRSQSVTPTSPRSRATSPTSPTPYSQPVHSPAPSLRMSSTTTTPTRPPSVAPPRSTSAAPPSHRSMTPSVRTGVYTPSPTIHRSESARPSTPAKTRSVSISGHVATPTKMMRSMSNESSSDEIQTQKDEAKERQREKDSRRVQLIQRWIPSLDNSSPPTGRSGFLSSLSRSNIPTPQPLSTPGRPRTVSNASAAFASPHRYRTPIPVNSP